MQPDFIQRADLHMHGTIGLQPYWLIKQGYAGKNILQLIADQAFCKGITIATVTSYSLQLLQKSVHDRFYCLTNFEAPLLPKSYSHDFLSKNMFIISKEDKRLYLINGQTVIAKESGKLIDHLVVGTNSIPSGLSLQEIFSYDSEPVIHIMEHPFATSHRGIGAILAEKYAGSYDAIEGLNAQCFSAINLEARILAEDYAKPWIATSDAHQISDIGQAYIEWTDNLNSKDNILTYLRDIIKSNSFKQKGSEVPFSSWLSWIALLATGSASSAIENKYLPSRYFHLLKTSDHRK